MTHSKIPARELRSSNGALGGGEALQMTEAPDAKLASPKEEDIGPAPG